MGSKKYYEPPPRQLGLSRDWNRVAWRPCRSCAGSRLCPKCAGRGRVMLGLVRCRECLSSGKCVACSGLGRLPTLID